MQVPHNSFVVVADGKKMLFFRNEGDSEFPKLEVERKRETPDAPDRDQKTDAPGRAFSSVSSGRSAYEEVDFHQLEEDRFAAETADLLKQRAAELPAPIQMCDALSRNVPKLPIGVEILLANCLAHGRRQFVEVATNFPSECRYVLEMLGQVYSHDAEARAHSLTPEQRLQLHQQRSGPVMGQLHDWLEAQFAEKRTEPNSGLGKAITYLLRHWRPLTTFLRVAGSPLDNNIVERALKRAVVHRKNALFYRTLNGAQVGDLFMSLIHTCQLCGANSFDYLIELQRHARELAAIRKPARRIHRLAFFECAPAAHGVKVFEREANRVHQVVTTRAGGIGTMRGQSLPYRKAGGHCVVLERRHIR